MEPADLIPGIGAPLCRRIRLDELPAEWKQHGAVAGAEKAKLPDTDESTRQHMKQKAAKKFVVPISCSRPLLGFLWP
jgi:hypothetical protein